MTPNNNKDTYDEIQEIKELICDGCRGLFYLHETECYERCEEFQEELKKEREENG